MKRKVIFIALVSAGYISNILDKLKTDFRLNKIYFIFQDSLTDPTLIIYLIYLKTQRCGRPMPGFRPDRDVTF